MKKLTRQVQTDRCPLCGNPILTTNWDDLEGLASDIRADPTPLTPALEVACTIADRPTYWLEQTAVRTYRLSRRHGYNTDRPVPYAVAVIPAHTCNGTFPTVLPAAVSADLNREGSHHAEQPAW